MQSTDVYLRDHWSTWPGLTNDNQGKWAR